MNKVDEYTLHSKAILEEVKERRSYGYKSFVKNIAKLLKEYPEYAAYFFAVQKEAFENLDFYDYEEFRKNLLNALNT